MGDDLLRQQIEALRRRIESLEVLKRALFPEGNVDELLEERSRWGRQLQDAKAGLSRGDITPEQFQQFLTQAMERLGETDRQMDERNEVVRLRRRLETLEQKVAQPAAPAPAAAPAEA
ncbi:MAG: hypothetical protein HY558_02455, partial [Euryarchaeota archaeon]|nr:hypothetical protein [Euryarchaeota archaeon]